MNFVLYELLPLILNMSLIGSVIIAIVLFCRFLMKKAPKIFSYILWSVVLFRLLCPFAMQTSFSIIGVFNPPTTVTGAIEYIPQNIVHTENPRVQIPLPMINDIINESLLQGEEQLVADPLEASVAIATICWLLGIAVMLVFATVQLIKLKSKLVGATPLKNNIYIADHISSPFVMGFINPKIYLPSSMTKSEQKFIIAHEQYHIERFDHITRILGFVALTVHWFNPLVWLAFILSGKDMEMSCDETVIKKMNTDIRAEYSQSLLRFATGKKIINATPLAFGESDTEERVKNVMKYKKPMLWVSVIAIIAVICVAVGLISNPKTEPIPKEAKDVSIENLWKYRTEYVGDNVAVGNIIFELSFPDNVQYKSFEIKTKEQPYEIIVYFDGINNALKSVDDDNGKTKTALNVDFAQLEQNAKIMFSLIGNVEKITFSVNRKDGGTLTNHYMRNDYDELFAKTAIYEEFQAVVYDILDNRNANILTDFQSIEIGTEKNKIREQFGEPNSTLSGMDGDIYIVDNKQIVIYYGVGGEDSYPITEVKISDYIPKIFTHDQAVVSALTYLNQGNFSGECFAEGHIILGYDDSDETKTKIYALTTIGWYGFENNNFVQVSGTAFPAVITLNSDNRVEIEEPLDGSDYAKSIEKMFPKEYHDRVFGYEDAERDNLKQQREKYASEYLSKIEREAKIGDYSDFDYTALTDEGVSVEASNNLENFYKAHNYYPSFIGTRERLENGVRMVYEVKYQKKQDEIRFTKYNYDTKEMIEQFIASAITGEIID